MTRVIFHCAQINLSSSHALGNGPEEASFHPAFGPGPRFSCSNFLSPSFAPHPILEHSSLDRHYLNFKMSSPHSLSAYAT